MSTVWREKYYFAIVYIVFNGVELTRTLLGLWLLLLAISVSHSKVVFIGDELGSVDKTQWCCYYKQTSRPPQCPRQSGLDDTFGNRQYQYLKIGGYNAYHAG